MLTLTSICETFEHQDKCFMILDVMIGLDIELLE